MQRGVSAGLCDFGVPETALQDLLVTAPAALREQLAGLYNKGLIHARKQLPEPETPASPTDAITAAIKSLAARCENLDAAGRHRWQRAPDQ